MSHSSQPFKTLKNSRQPPPCSQSSPNPRGRTPRSLSLLFPLLHAAKQPVGFWNSANILPVGSARLCSDRPVPISASTLEVLLTSLGTANAWCLMPLPHRAVDREDTKTPEFLSNIHFLLHRLEVDDEGEYSLDRSCYLSVICTGMAAILPYNVFFFSFGASVNLLKHQYCIT